MIVGISEIESRLLSLLQECETDLTKAKTILDSNAEAFVRAKEFEERLRSLIDSHIEAKSNLLSQKRDLLRLVAPLVIRCVRVLLKNARFGSLKKERFFCCREMIGETAISFYQFKVNRISIGFYGFNSSDPREGILLTDKEDEQDRLIHDSAREDIGYYKKIRVDNIVMDDQSDIFWEVINDSLEFIEITLGEMDPELIVEENIRFKACLQKLRDIESMVS